MARSRSRGELPRPKASGAVDRIAVNRDLNWQNWNGKNDVREISMSFPVTRRTIVFAALLAGLVVGLAGCKSGGAQASQAPQEPISEEQRVLVQKEQDRLDAVEQQRTGNASAHSCRKAKEVYEYSNTKIVDTDGCSAEQLKLEQDAEQRQAHDKVLAERMQKMNEMREKMEHNLKPVKAQNSPDQ